jgi:hypothetical protein
MIYLPNSALRIVLPILRSKPDFDVGIPVVLANCCLACVTPSARFQENDTPGIFMIVVIYSFSVFV